MRPALAVYVVTVGPLEAVPAVFSDEITAEAFALAVDGVCWPALLAEGPLARQMVERADGRAA